MFNKICVLGCGLIGSSLLRAIDKKKLAKNVETTLDLSKALISLDNFFLSIALSKEDPIKPQPKTQILLNINNFL